MKSYKTLSIYIYIILFLFILGCGRAVHHISPPTSPQSWTPHVEREVLENGMTILILERHHLPILTVDLKLRAGAIYDPDKLVGIANLTSRLLVEGTIKRTSDQISEEIDFIGGSLTTSCSEDYAGATLTILKKDIDTGFDLLADILMNPAFREEEISKKRDKILAEIIQEKEDPGSVASKAFFNMVFNSHPYHRPLEGSEETLTEIKQEDILSFYNRYYHPNNLIMAIVGDINKEEALSIVKRYLGGWEKKEIDFPTFTSPSGSDKRRVEIIDKDITQANIFIGGLGIERSHPDYYSVRVMNYILGDTDFSSRLMKKIRDDLGLVYSIYSDFDMNVYSGAFFVNLQTKNESADQAVEGVIKEMERISSEMVSDEELEDAKSYLTGSFPMKIDTNSKAASILTSIEFYNLGLDYFEEFPKGINGVTKEDVLKAAMKYLPPDNYILVVVADKDKIKIKQ